MSNNKEFVEEARSYYKSLPLETGLYKKYSVGIPLDLTENGRLDGSNIDALAADISEKTRIKFDAVISGSGARSTNDKVKTLTLDQLGAGVLAGKLFKSSEDKLAAFVNSKTKYFVVITADPDSNEKINLLFLNDDSLIVQIFVNAGERSRVEILELYASSSQNQSLVAPLHEIRAKSDSHVEIDMIHNENDRTYLVGLCKADAKDKAKVKLNFVYNGTVATKVRNIIDANGARTLAEVTELVFGSKEQAFDISTHIGNSTPLSSAMIDSGIVLDDKSRCMIKGFAKIENGSKGAFSKITERGILLSADAHIDALPDMSIDYSNEVKATHSAATSPIDKEALFYLSSRGISEDMSRKLFVTSFLTKYLLNMGNGVAKELAMSILLDKLERRVFGVIPEVTPKGVWMASRS